MSRRFNKADFLQWFLEVPTIKNKECLLLLEYMIENKDCVLDRVFFIKNDYELKNFDNAIYIPSKEIIDKNFYYKRTSSDFSMKISNLGEAYDYIKSIDANEDLFICLDFKDEYKSAFNYLYFEDYSTYYDDDYYEDDDYEDEDDELLEMFLDLSSKKEKQNNNNFSHSYTRDNDSYEMVKKIDLDLFIKQSEKDGYMLVLKNKIDEALDNKDKELFLKLTDELLKLQIS